MGCFPVHPIDPLGWEFAPPAACHDPMARSSLSFTDRLRDTPFLSVWLYRADSQTEISDLAGTRVALRI